MMVSAILAGVSPWISGQFEGECCEQCGRRDVLKLFRVEICCAGKKISRKVKLCGKCMEKAKVEIFCLPTDNRIH